MIDLELPWPPSVNRYWRVWRNRAVLSAEAKLYRQNVIAAVKEQLTEQRRRRGPLEGSIAMRLVLYPPDRRRRDVDNVQKALLDAMQHAGVYKDDAQVDFLSVERGKVDVLGEGCVTVEITRWHVAEEARQGRRAL